MAKTVKNRKPTKKSTNVPLEEFTPAPFTPSIDETPETLRTKAKTNLFSLTPSDDRKFPPGDDRNFEKGEKLFQKKVSYAREDESKKIQKEHLNKLNIEMENLKQSVIFLLPMIKTERHKNIQNWLNKLQPADDIAIMQHYILFLHYLKENVERGKLQFPFTKLPPPVLDGLNCYVEDEIFKRLHDQYESSINYTRPTIKEIHAPAKEFFSRQPKPSSGIYCYAVAFSDSREE